MAKTAEHYLGVAKKHLVKVQDAWDEPTDWADLTMYGLYCIESCVIAASQHAGLDLKHRTKHWGKSKLAKKLHEDHGLPDVEDLMEDLNDGRKAEAYGDEDFEEDDFNAEDVASDIERYVSAVEAFLAGGTS